MRRDPWWWLVAALAIVAIAGCRREVSPDFASSGKVLALPEEAQAGVRLEMRDRIGTFAAPKLLADEGTPTAESRKAHARLRKGQEVYQYRCVQCHGANGDGNGPAAYAMYPKPRDYRKGLFKFTSTPYGAKPVRSDLVRTVTSGVRGTSMPDFKLLPAEEIDAVVEYVIFLAQRGQLEEQVADLGEFEGKVTREMVDEEGIVPSILESWKKANEQQVSPFTPQPVFTADHIRRGKAAFLTKGCSKCHGEDGRGQTPDNLAGNLKDSWGHITRAADLSSGMLHGGQMPMDIYRRIVSGINGTPMPGFADALEKEPDTIWDLVSFVLFVSGRRRAGETPAPGPISPYVPGEPTTAGVLPPGDDESDPEIASLPTSPNDSSTLPGE